MRSPGAPRFTFREWLLVGLALTGVALLVGFMRPSIATLQVHGVIPVDALEQLGAPTRQVPLPHICQGVGNDWRCRETFRLPLPSLDAGAKSQALYIPSFGGAIQVLAGRHLLVDSRHVYAGPGVERGAPLFVPLPPQVESRELRLVSEGVGEQAGLFGPVYVGDAELLLEAYEHRALRLVVFPKLLDGAVLMMALSALLVWILGRRERHYLLFGLVTLAVSAPAMLPLLPQDASPLLPVSLLMGKPIAAALLVPAFRSFLGCKPSPWEYAFLLLPAAVYLMVHALPPAIAIPAIQRIAPPVALGIVIWACALMFHAALRRGHRAALVIGGTMLVLLTYGVLDVMAVDGNLELVPVDPARRNRHLFALVCGVMLLWHFLSALRSVESSNETLRESVAAAESKLRASLEREQQQQREMEIAGERIRMMQDLHDGLGGQLLSLVTLSQSAATSREQLVDAAQRALSDLRLVVASLEDTGGDLGYTLGMFRERIDPLLRIANVQLEWQIGELPGCEGLQPRQTLQILRILQEAVTNAVRHSGARRIRFTAVPSPHPGWLALIEVRDWGRGGATERAGGMGLINQRLRASRSGLRLQIHSPPGEGTVVVMEVPSP